MAEETFQLALAGEPRITVVRRAAEGPPAGWSFIYAPGAGSSVRDSFGVYLSEQLSAKGVDAYRFQFPYMEAGRKAPDRPPVLMAAWRAVIDHVAQARAPAPLAIGGRSMGGRIASMVAADNGRADALALFAYPLHAPGDTRWRDAHLPAITAPTLFCSGTNDAFATPEELRVAAARVPRHRVYLLEGADHGFAVKRESGRTRPQVYQEAVRTLLDWLGSL